MKRKVGLVTSPAPKDTRQANTERILLFCHNIALKELKRKNSSSVCI